jgi:hypothetical protein
VRQSLRMLLEEHPQWRVELVPAVAAIAAGEVFVSPAIHRGAIAEDSGAKPRR